LLLVISLSSGIRHDAAMFDPLTLFGLFAVTTMLITYALEDRGRWFTLAFAGSRWLGSAYG